MTVLRQSVRRWLSSSTVVPDQVASLQHVRSVLRLSGPTLIHFLQVRCTSTRSYTSTPSPSLTCPPTSQGLLTNDVSHLHTHQPIYSCILNAQGRYLHDLFIHPIQTTVEDTATATTTTAVLLDVSASAKEDMLRLLKRYRLRQQIDIDDVSSEYQVWTRFGGGDALSIDNATPSPPPLANPWPSDPRLLSLGFRTILSTSDAQSQLSPTPHATPVSSHTEYKRWRMGQGVAEGDEEIPSGDAIALEYNIDGLHGISFTKGCYVGQELMARTHFKGVVRKRVMPVEFGPTTVPVAVGAAVVDGTTQKSIGTVRVVDENKGIGLALLRLKEALDEKRALRVVGEDGTTVVAEIVHRKRPEWWPETWGNES